MSYRKPKTRQRIHKEPPALAVPDINDDAAERKRALNVLAQRRYRERKRQNKDRGTARDTVPTPQSTPRDEGSNSPLGEDALVSDNPILEQEPSISTYLDLLPAPDSASASLEFVSDVVSQTRWPAALFEATGPNLLPEKEQSCTNTTDPILSALQMGASVIGAEATSFGFLDTMDPRALIGSSSSSPSVSENSETITDISFPDSYYLPVNELTFLRGLMRIAIRLRCNTTKLWELGANSPFNDGTHTALTTQELPQVWRPTFVAVIYPTSSCYRLASMAQLAIAHLAYDLEDTAEGVRIWGDDPCEPTSWEVGQVLFERWWFIFDRQVVDQSNYWRKLRGAATLRMKS
ncbi:hypothetical protein F4823DRAFT_557577 [Ustulina deusta]|nr:hypothetical protein F4823DRAFT_557577 [Ustulina deusta]